ncbi:hypothetical protein ACSS6W_007420 [Trichoderma asperelloides]
MAQSTVHEETILRVISSLDEEQRQELFEWCDCIDGEILRRLLTLSKRQPGVFNTIALDALPEEPVLDYITDLEARNQILLRFQSILQKVKSDFKIDMAFVAVLMVSPIDVLQSRLRALRESIRKNDLDVVHEFFSDCEKTILPSILGYVNKGGRRSTSQPSSAKNSSKSSSIHASPAKRPRVMHGRSLSYPDAPIQPRTPPPPTTPLPVTPLPIRVSTDASPPLPVPQSPRLAVSSSSRNPIAAQLCKKRDDYMCLFTEYENPEAAHIFPFAATKNSQTSNLLSDLLRMFWGDGAADQLSTLAQDRGITESPQNLLSLNHQLHWWFDSAKLAFKPLRKPDDGSVVVQFHWLKAGKSKASQKVEVADLRQILKKAGLESNTWGTLRAHRASGLQLETGQTFTLKANNPGHVPNFNLLQLSWDLLRVVAICGAAEEELDDESDADDGGFSIEASEGIYEEDNGAQIYQWAAEVEMEEEGEEVEEEKEEKDSVHGAKSPH